MKTTITRFIVLVSLLFSGNVASAGAALVAEELAVVQAMAAILNRDSARPFDFLYFESSFAASPYVESALANPDRTQFCGLTREQAQGVLYDVIDRTARPVVFDKSIAKPAGLSLGRKKLERFRYLTLSRVVFTADGRSAWMAADLNGESGALFRLDKVGDTWNKAARCGGWVKS